MVSPRIFIVEDEAVIAADLRRLVQSFGYSVAGVAHDPESAVERIAASEPDLVLMDIRLGPGADGVDVASRVTSASPVPVVFLTAHGDPDTVARATGTLPFGYVIKPFEEPELRAAIEVALARSDAETRLRADRDRAEGAFRELPVGAVTTDASLRVTGMNKEAERILGGPAMSFESKPVDDVVTLVDRESGVALPGFPAQALLSGSARPPAGKAALVTASGRVPVDLMATRIADQDDQPVGCLIAFLTEDEGRARRPAVDNPLSPREREVLALLAEGLDANAISKRLDITMNTTRDHLKALRRKLGATSQVEVLVTAIRRGLLT